MKLFPLLLLALFSFATTAQGQSPRVVKTQFPTDDLVIAGWNVRQSPYNARGDGKTDDTAALQRAIDDAGKAGGGVVFVPSGVYRCDGNLRIKAGVTLRGDRPNPRTQIAKRDASTRGDAGRIGKTRGTILAIYAGHGQETGTPFLTLEKVAGVCDLSFWYPRQNAENIVPYPWTVGLTDNSSCGYAVQRVTFVNSYQALSHGADAPAGQGFNVAYFSQICGTPLKLGVWYEYILDITRTDRVHFSPRYWEESGLPNAPASTRARTSLRDFLLRNATAITVRRFDWCPLYNVEIEGYGVGVHLTEKPGVGNSNGEMYGVRVEGGRIGLLVDNVQPASWLLSRCTFRALAGAGNAAVLCRPTLQYLLQFNTCTLGKVSLERGASGALSLENCTLEEPMEAASGEIALVNTRVANRASTRAPLTLGEDVSNALLAGGDFVNAKIAAANPGVVRRENAPIALPVPDAPHPFSRARRPRGNALFNVKTFGARGDATSDDTTAFQDALRAASTRGGTVYIPAGRYRITRALTVPSGVEMRGVFEGPPHTMIPGSCILAEAGHGSENGAPLISLRHNSGVRGVVVWYPRQDFQNLTPYPWTIRALGPRCHVRDVALANSYNGADFASASDTSDHLVSGLMGAPQRRGLFVGKGKRGVVENVQFVIHYWSRNDSGLPGPTPPTDQQGIALNNRALEGFRFANCENERVLATFLYAGRIGLQIGNGFRGTLHQHGSDSVGVGVKISGDARATFINTNSVPFAPQPFEGELRGLKPTAYRTNDDFSGDVRFLNSAAWGISDSRVFHLGGSGAIAFSQININGTPESVVANANARLSALYATRDREHSLRFDVPTPQNAMLFSRVRAWNPQKTATQSDAVWHLDAASTRRPDLRLLNGWDGIIEAAQRAGADAITNKEGATPKSDYIYFDVDEPFAFALNEAPLFATVEYFDEAPATAPILQFDSVGEGDAAKYRNAQLVSDAPSSGDATWKRAVFSLERPVFSNRQNMNADFRLSRPGARLIIRRVTLSKGRLAQ